MKDKFSELEAKAGRETRLALEEMYSLWGKSTYEWLAGLWEPEIGGFYYSESGRDHEGFLPDIESTLQAIGIVRSTGMLDEWGGSYYDAFPAWLREKLVSFTKSLADPDGYYYHPQWGKDIITRRRSRDLTWAISMLKNFNEKPPMPTALDLLASDKKEEVAAAPHLASEEAFAKYLEEMDIYKQSYVSGSTIGSQAEQIKAAGLDKMLIDHYNEKQNPKNGLWADSVTYYSVSGLLKISSSYQRLGYDFPNLMQAVDSAVENALCPESPGAATMIFNPWSSIGNLLSIAKEQGREADALAIRERVYAKAPELLRITTEKMKLFRKDDGSFSYCTWGAVAKSQDAPVALGINEGDVNATMLIMNGASGAFFKALEIKPIPVYDGDDYRRFISLLEKQTPPKKKPIPESVKK